MSGRIVAAALVPGLPHLLASKPSPGWTLLADAMRALGDRFRSRGVTRLMVVSTQWVSVLGLQVQMRHELAGTRVDENWYPYDFGTLEFALRSDVALSERWMRELRTEGFQARPTSHLDFPVDTGLLVATRLLDPQGSFELSQVSLNLYGSAESVEKVGAAAVRAAAGKLTSNGSARAGDRIGLLAIGGLSSHPHRSWISPDRDAIASPADEQLNQRVLEMLRQGDTTGLYAAREGIAARGAMDGQLRALCFLHGGWGLSRPADVMAYGPIWGMGAAVVDWPSADGGGDDNLIDKQRNEQ